MSDVAYMMRNVLVVGPDPSDPSRNGGVAKYVSYLSKVRFKRYNVKFLYTDIRWLSSLGFLTIGRAAAAVLGSLKLLLASRYAAVHINATLSQRGCYRVLPYILAAKLRRIPVFIQIHGGRWANVEAKKMPSWLWIRIFKQARRIGAFSGAQSDELNVLTAQNGMPKVVELKNFVVDTGVCERFKSDSIHFLFLGRLIKDKGLMDVLEAFSRIVEEVGGNKVFLSIVGSGPLSEAAEEYSIKCENITCHGYKSGRELENLLSDANVFVLPSSYPEGFPLSFLECGVKGIVPMISENSAIPTYFSKGEEYIPVYPGEVTSTKNAMLELALNRSFRMEVGTNVREKIIDEFEVSSPAIVSQYEDVYADIGKGL